LKPRYNISLWHFTFLAEIT